MDETGGVLPRGVVTLLLADVEGSTRLWETEPEVMAAALARLEDVIVEVLGRHDGARPLEQGEGDSFVAAFTRASDAAAAALDLQRAELDPLRLRIGIHTGEVALRDDQNYMGPAMNRTARLRDLGHGGQTLLSQATHDIVVDALPGKATLTDLGTHRLKDLARPERVHQLSHPELAPDFPPLRSVDAYPNNLPVQLTSFIGREAELAELRALLAEHRLVTLTGSGGAGKTRLALQIAAEVLANFPDGVWHVELAPVNEGDLVPVVAMRALGVQEDPSQPSTERLLRHLGEKRVLLILDNCEHLVGACAEVTQRALQACPGVAVLATSREPLGVPGERTWRIPSLAVSTEQVAATSSEAVELFVDRARQVRAGFHLTYDNSDAVVEICRRLDGLPLAIELAAARVRVLSPTQIAEGLHDRFRLLAGGARTAVPRQQTLRASVEWSYNLLTDLERQTFRQLAVFAGSFDLAAARAVASAGALENDEVLDQLTSLVDKSLVVAEDEGSSVRYRLLETVRQFALDQLSASGEAEAARRRHRDHYAGLTQLAALASFGPDPDESVALFGRELDNLRLAYQWSLDAGDIDAALALAAGPFRYWATQAPAEGRVWADTVLTRHPGEGAPVMRLMALAASAVLEGAALSRRAVPRGDEAIALARELESPVLTAMALGGAGIGRWHFAPSEAVTLLREAVTSARQSMNPSGLATMLWGLGCALCSCGEPGAAADAFETMVDLHDGEGHHGRWGRSGVAMSHLLTGELATSLSIVEGVIDEAERVRDPSSLHIALWQRAVALVYSGRPGDAAESARRSGLVAVELGRNSEAAAAFARGLAAFAVGRLDDAHRELTDAVQLYGGSFFAHDAGALLAEVVLAAGDLSGARRLVDAAVEGLRDSGAKALLHPALTTASRISMAEGDLLSGESVAHQALAVADSVGNKLGLCDTLELLASLAASHESHQEAARLLGAADAMRNAIGYVRFEIRRPWYESLLVSLRDALGEEAFAKAWAEGEAMSLDEAVAYAQRGRGERKRPTAGWDSLTPAELDVVRLVAEGLPNKEIATRLFISPRTVQAHLTHVYAKVGVSSRVQLATEAAKRT